jgi:tRNA (guanosine-2'-O-)-methyltransferase
VNFEHDLNLIYEEQSYSSAEILEKLSKFLTDERLLKISDVVKNRSSHFVTVLENIYDRGNISAVMRSCEAFGFYKMHLINQASDSFKESKRVTQGADKWLDVKTWSESEECIAHLKKDGYKVFTTSLIDDSVALDQVDFTKKTALILGNERDGVSEIAKSMSDGNVLLPMYGFTQSFNISVAGALSLQTAKSKNPPTLDEAETLRLRALYILNTLAWPDNILKEALTKA